MYRPIDLNDELEKAGFKRIVLSRELSLNEIEHITSNTSCEIEVFTHGALCISYSGQCLISSLIGGRSGNRGKCAQPCRKLYSIYQDDKLIEENKSILSMNDLNTLDHMINILDSGVSSLKIEGRMKSPEYVYTVTKAYRDIIDQIYKEDKYKIDSKTLENVLVTYNRGFTKGYLFNELNLDFLTCGYYNFNIQSKRVCEKFGAKFLRFCCTLKISTNKLRY